MFLELKAVNTEEHQIAEQHDVAPISASAFFLEN